ncbi:hypothetical protein [Streptomyces sp. 8N616]|uniref:hypothetical protein n=1 Tax=Streptomyces sp. 8N616 TaxID=3457414 RepID=UPI003FCF2292
MAPNGLSPRAAVAMSLVIAVLLGALSGLVMFPAALHLRSLQDGERAQATLHKSGSCMAGHCQVTFEADGRTIVADLPVGSGGGKNAVGTEWTVRYQADDPLTVAREEDVGGGGALVFAVLSGAFTLLFLVAAVWMALYSARQRRAAIGPRCPDGGAEVGS